MTGFTALADAFLEDEFEANPVLASQLGLSDYDARLPDLSADAFERRNADAERWLERFESVPGDELTTDEQIDRDLATAVLRGRLIVRDWTDWRRDPLTYSAPLLTGVFTLFLHRLRPERELVDAAVTRLDQATQAFAQGRANLDAALAHPLIVERGRNAARGGVRFLGELLAAEVKEDGADRDRLSRAGRAAAESMRDWVEWLDEFASRADGDWQLGEERYSRLLRERENLGYDARGLRELGRVEYDRLDHEMTELARTIDPAGDGDWRVLLERANQDHPRTQEEMRDRYDEWSQRARTFLAETGLVTLPRGEACVVEPSPVFQRPVIGVASYIAPPTFSDRMLGHFFVPYAPDGTSADEIQERLAANNHGGIPTTAVHEAYPGHHWHLVMAKSNPSRLRRAFGSGYFIEGWALYAERVMRERGFFTDPLQELYHLNATIFRAARIVVDTSLHLGEMTHDDAVRFMVKQTALPEATARTEVGRYCWWPTQASGYLTGCLEILRIRDRFLETRGVGDDVPRSEIPVAVLRDFHDRLCSSGKLPLGLAERAVLGS